MVGSRKTTVANTQCMFFVRVGESPLDKRKAVASDEAELATLTCDHTRQRPLFLIQDKENLRQRRSGATLWAHTIAK